MTVAIETRAWRWWPRGPALGRLARGGLALALLAPALAYAQPYPTIEPRRPVAVTYDLSSTATGPMRIQAFADPAQQVARLQLGQGADYVLLDRATEQVMLVSPDKGLVFVVSTAGMLHRRLGPDSGLRFTRTGHRMIVGEGCTVWSVIGPSGRGDACITQDGVVLEGTGQGDRPDDHGQIPAGHLLATAVSYAPLPRSLFAPPHGLQEVDLPPSLFRAMIPGLAGIPNP
jgi:hypothetical protein